MQRISIVAAILLIAQIAFAVVINIQQDTVQHFSPQAVFLDFNPDQATSVSIVTNEKQELLLQKEGDQWILASDHSVPADGKRVADTLKQLAEIQHGLAVATTANGAKRFHVDGKTYEKHVVIKDKDQVIADFYLGTTAGFRQTHAAKNGEHTVVTLNLNSFDFDPEVKQWLDKKILEVSEKDIKQVDFNGFTLTKEKENWQMTVDGATSKVTTGDVTKLLEKVAEITVDDVVEPEQAKGLFKEPLALEFTLHVQEDKALNFAFAPRNDTTFALKRSDIDHTFVVPKYVLENLKEFSADSFTKQVEKENTAETESVKPQADEEQILQPQQENSLNDN